METFLDGGLFEILIAMVFAIILNFIFLKKYLLIIFSLLIIFCPVILFFINRNELYYWFVSLSIFNSVLLIVLLWREKKTNPNKPLFNVDILKNKLSEIKKKFNTVFRKKITDDKFTN
jgi:hypothetical protein